VGRETIDLVARSYPDAEVHLYASRSQVLDHLGRQVDVSSASDLERLDAPRGDLALVALDDECSKRYVPRLLELGYRVIDKSNTYRHDPSVPLVVAGANHNQIDETTRLVANPNCTTVPLMLALVPLKQRFGLRSVTVSSYQAVSGAGIGPLDEFLRDSRRGYAEADRLGERFAVDRYAGNTVPHNAKTDDSGFSGEERKLMQESRKILSLPSLAVSVQCCRVAVAVGHYMNAWITLERPASLPEVEAVLSSAPFIRHFAGAVGNGLTALACVHDRDRALAGRLRRDDRDETNRSFCLTLCGDNLRLGAATNAVRIASVWFPGRDPELTVSRN
jgi:aspartate-semialdehyde dehydrogenase